VKNGIVNGNLLRNEASKVANTDAVIEPDYHTNRDNIRERATGTPKKREAFNQWIREKFESMVTKERIFKGYTNSGSKRYQPHTLENVVAELRKGLQGEEGMNYGLGSVRSGAAKEFQSIDEIQQDRNQIVPHDEFNKIKEELSNEYSEIMELVKPYYKYDTEGWGYSTSVSESLLDYAKKGRSVDFKPMPTEVRKQLNDFMNRLKHMPTEYFESKVQRAVDLSEFKAAIVPNKTPQNVIDILEDKGIKVSKYNPDKEGDRSRKVETASKKNNLRFRVEGSIDKTAEITNPEYWKGKTFGYIHNSQPSENMGSMFGQDVEPAGKYITMDYAFIPANYVEGTVTFNNPLVIDITGQEYPQWKKDLSLLNKGVTGKKLSNKLRQQGYDAIITVEQYKGNYYPSETVILDNEIDSMKGARFRVENLDAKIEQLQNQRERVVAEKNRLIKQANQRNGLFGDTQATANDMFAGQGFAPQEILKKEQGYNAEIQRIDNEIALLKKQLATGKVEASGQMTMFRVASNENEVNNFVKDSKVKETVYHGTNANFTEFNPQFIGLSSGNEGHYGYGFYFSFDEREAKTYGSNIINATVNIKNPFTMSDRQLDELKDNGIDWIDDKVDLRLDYNSVYSELNKLENKEPAELLKHLHENGYEKGWEKFLSDKSISSLTWDANIINDIYEATEYNDQLRDYIYDDLKELGVNTDKIKTIKGYQYEQSLHWITDLGNKAKIVTDVIKKLGYDGVIYGSEIVAFEPEQILITQRNDVRFQIAEPTNTKAFKKWFGNSKVVDENGEPLVVYHGTNKEFNQFDKSDRATTGMQLDGFYLTSKKGVADAYAHNAAMNHGEFDGDTERTMPLYVSIQNPKYYENLEDFISADRFSLEAEGYDGAIRNNPDNEPVEIVAFEPTQIKSATGNNGEFDSNNPDIRFRIIGERGAANLDKSEEATIRIDNLMVAKQMEKTGMSALNTKQATGWERGADGKWRYEVPDVKLTIRKAGKYKIKNAVSGDILKEYPQLKKTTVQIIPRRANSQLQGYNIKNKIVIYANSINEAENILGHEIQHSIQELEGFEKGTSSTVDGGDSYMRSAGEVEARNVQKRSGMSDEERRNSLLSDTEDISREDQIFLSESFNNIRFKVDEAAQEVNTNPTDPQKHAGNYKMGHVRFDGFDISIENPKGSIRSGKDKTGREWQQQLPADYGYFRGTKGRDKDHIDVFIGPKPENERIYVVDQIDPATGNYDEAKVMLGFDNISQARNTYLAAYETGWKGLGEITRTDKAGLKEWFASGKTTQPFYNSKILFRSENADELTNYDNSKYDIAELKGKLYYSPSDQLLITSKNIDQYISEFEVAYEEASSGGTHAFFEYLDNMKSTRQIGQFGVKITKDGNKYTFVYDPDKWLRESAKILKPYEYKTNLRNSIRSLYNEIGDFNLIIPEANIDKKASEFLHIDQGVRFAIRSDNPEVDQLFRQLDKLQRSSGSSVKVKGLKNELDHALVFEKPDIIKQIKDLKEGIRLGQKDTKERIKAIQTAIINYAKRNMPYDEVGKRDMFSVINKIRDAQTPRTIEKAFEKIDEITKENESNKNIRAVERLIKWMTNFRQKGQNKEGKFTYETVKEFEEFKRIHKEAIAHAAIKNSTKATAKQKAEADKALEAMWQEIDQKESKSLLDHTTMKLIELRRNGRAASKELIQAIREDLQAIYDAAKDAKTAEDIEKVIYRKEDRNFVKQFLDGQPIPDRKRLQRWIASINGFLADTMGNWETILTMMGGYKLRDKFSLIINQVEKEVNTQEAFDKVMGTAMKGYGLKDKKALQKKLNEMKKKEYSIVKPIREGDRGEGSDIPLSKLMLIDIYNAIQNEEIREDMYLSYGDLVTNPDDGRPNEILQRRIGKERIDKLMENLSEGDIIFAKAMQQTADSYYSKINDVFIRTFNRDLPKRDNYWPSTAEFQNENDAFNQMLNDSLHPSATKERATRRTPKITDAFEKFAKHIKNAEWYANMALPVTRLNNIFKNPNVKDLIEDNYGENFYRLITEHLQEQGLYPKSNKNSLNQAEKAADWLLNNWVAASIGLTPSVPVKQLLSVINYSENMPVGTWTANFIKNMANPAKTWKEIMEIPYLKTRLGTGYSEAVQHALNSNEGVKRVTSIHQAMKELATIGTRYGDIAAIAFGGKPYLDYLIKEKGMDEKEAVDQFLLDTLRSQQSPFSSTLSKFQNRKTPLTRALFAFANTPSQYMRKMVEGYHAYKNGDITKGQLAKVLTIYGVLNNVSYVVVGALMGSLLSGNDWDDDLIKKLIVQTSTSVVGGIPMVRDIAELLANTATDSYVFDDVNPILEGPSETIKAINKAARSDDPEKAKKQMWIATKYFMQMFGISGRNLEKIYKATVKRGDLNDKVNERQVNDKLKELSEPKTKIDAELKGMSNYYKKTRKNKPDYKAAETAHELKYAYSSAKSKATKLEGEGKKAQAERLREAVIQSKANLNDSDFTLRDIEQELKSFNSRVESITD
jgi:hypothetical protein